MLQLAGCQISSSAQTAALIEQENVAEVLSNKLVSTGEELRMAEQLISELRTQCDARPSPALGDAGHFCKTSTEKPHIGVHTSPTLQYADFRAEMTQLDDQLSALACENGCLRTDRYRSCLLVPPHDMHADAPCTG